MYRTLHTAKHQIRFARICHAAYVCTSSSFLYCDINISSNRESFIIMLSCSLVVFLLLMVFGTCFDRAAAKQVDLNNDISPPILTFYDIVDRNPVYGAMPTKGSMGVSSIVIATMPTARTMM